MSDPGPAVGRLSGCPYCDALLPELAALRQRCEMLERLVRVDSALARQLSRSMQLNA